MAKLSSTSNFILPLYCAFQDDEYVYLAMERGSCTLKQLIQHSHEDELRMLLDFQHDHALKFLSFCMLMRCAISAHFCAQFSAQFCANFSDAAASLRSAARRCSTAAGRCSARG